MVTTEFISNASNLHLYEFNGSRPDEKYLCYPINIIQEKGLWLEINPMAQALPLFLLQLIILTGLNRIIVTALRPLRQPVIVAELLAGILGGSSALMWRSRFMFLKAVFSTPTVMLLETFGNLGLVYSLFLLGLEIDMGVARNIGKRVYGIATVGTLITFAFGVVMYFVCLGPIAKTYPSGSLYWGFAVCVNGLPVVADTLACLKLLNSDIGKTAMLSALVGNQVSWGLLVLILASVQKISALWVILSIIVFVLICIYAIKPAILWLAARKREDDELSESNVCIILTIVLACGFLTDMLGLTSLVGAFMLGVILPYEVIGHDFVVFLQGFVTYFFVPIYFTLVGFRFQIFHVLQDSNAPLFIVMAVVLLSVSKFLIILGTSSFLDAPFHDRLTLGLLGNAKGLLSVVAITIGHDHQAVDDTGFAIMLMVIVITTMSSTPIINFINHRARRLSPNKHRSLQRLRPETELRILACVHEHHSVTGIINLLESCYATRKSPICVFALQLVELTKQTAALFTVQRPNHSSSALPDATQSNRFANNTEQLTDAFVNLEQECSAFFVHPLTAMSAYDTMHEDICYMAEDKRVTLVLLPFHKRQTIHNRMEDSNPSHKDVNDNVLVNAPCTVGILVDRGLGSVNSEDESTGQRLIVMIFIGGPDDREALAYAARMGSHPSVMLTVIRLVPDKNAVRTETNDGAATVMIYPESEKQLDDTYVTEFRNRTVNNNSVLYLEKVSNNGDETVETIRSLGVKSDLYVVGRGLGVKNPLTAGLADWGDCPELGAIGDLLLTSDFASASSILVVQQYVELKGNSSIEDSANMDRVSESSENTVHVSRRQSRPHFDQFAEERDVMNRL